MSNSIRSISDFEGLRAIALDRVTYKFYFYFLRTFYFLRQLPIKFLGLLFSDVLNFDMVYDKDSLFNNVLTLFRCFKVYNHSHYFLIN